MDRDDGPVAEEKDVYGRDLDIHAFTLLQCVGHDALVPVRATQCGLYVIC